tara:strand:- start:275 stop:691 length:417 start_codon:yes stop_codon:yes gene_type:complete
MKWLSLKHKLKKAWVWLKNHWYAPLIFCLLIIALLVFVITKNGAYVAALLDVLDKSSKSHKEEVDTLNNLHNREIVEKNLILKEYQENLSKIEEEYAKKNEELDAEKKKELKKMVEDGYDDPEKLSREIARMFGLEHG